jgi:predicted deacetylase
VSLLVVPRHHGGPAWRPGVALRWLRARAAAGDEVVLHGYAHLTPSGRDRGELRGRSRRDVWARVREGAEELRRVGVDPDGFIAPAYAHPRSTDVACAAAGLGWWATRTMLRSPAGDRRLPSIGVGASTALRRRLSPAAARAAARALAHMPAVRLDLHRWDLAHPDLAAADLELLALLLAQGRTLRTHGALAPFPRAAAA